jgi:hypothetical protein
LGEALGKVIITVVDSLTPRTIRMLLLGLVVGLAYGWWLHDARLQKQQEAIQDYKVEMAGLRADMKAIVKSSEEGNEELKAIRQWLMARK